jgi:hypothetical protein
MTTEKMKKNDKKYCCEICDFNTCKKKNFDIHLQTQKHKNNVLTTDDNEKNDKKYCCEICEKNFNDRAGLWRHKKKCIIINKDHDYENSEETGEIKEFMKYLIKENSEFKNLMMEMMKNGVNNNTLINNNNSHNKTFNLQFFLNETCKDAMNIMDFVDSVKLQLSDLENVGKLGYIDGISDIIVKNLKALDVEKRPVHCTDSKREVMYVKDDGKWYNDTKEEDQENKKLKRAIKRIANKNSNLLSEFKAKYPDCIYSHSTKSDQYNKIIIEALGGSDINSENKIIKKIAREVTVPSSIKN